MEEDIRWQQRFSNYKKALAQLERFLEKSELNELEILGIVQAFEYTFELAWKTLQDLLIYKGFSGISGPKPVSQQAFQDGSACLRAGTLLYIHTMKKLPPELSAKSGKSILP